MSPKTANPGLEKNGGGITRERVYHGSSEGDVFENIPAIHCRDNDRSFPGCQSRKFKKERGSQAGVVFMCAAAGRSAKNSPNPICENYPDIYKFSPL